MQKREIFPQVYIIILQHRTCRRSERNTVLFCLYHASLYQELRKMSIQYIIFFGNQCAIRKLKTTVKQTLAGEALRLLVKC